MQVVDLQIFMKAPRYLFILIAVLIIIHLIILSWFSIEESRWARVLTSAVFMGVYFLHFSKHTLLLAGALLSFLIADIFTLSYHLESSKDAYFILHGIAFSMLVIFIMKRTIRESWSRFQKNYILITAALCFGLLLFFGFTFSNEIRGVQHLIFFYFHGLAIIAILITSLSFYERKTDSFSLLFLIATQGLVFSDLTAFSAEYLKAEGFYYFSRIFYVAGLAGLVRFSFLSKPSASIAETISPVEIEPKKDKAYHDH